MTGIESLFTDDELTALAALGQGSRHFYGVGIDEMMATGLMDLVVDKDGPPAAWATPITLTSIGAQLTPNLVLRLQLSLLLDVPADSTHEAFRAAIAALGTGLGSQYLVADLATKLGVLIRLESQ